MMSRFPIAISVLAIILAAPVLRAQDEGRWRLLVMEGMRAAGNNDLAGAEQSLNKAVREAETFGAHDTRIGTTLNSLGLVYRAEHKYAEAESAYRRALVLIEAAYPDSIDVANISFNIANVMFDAGHQAESMPMIQKTLRLYEKLLGDSSLKTAAALCMEGDAWRAMKRYPDAEKALRGCADIREKDSGLNSPDLADALLSLARVFTAEGKLAIAEPRYKMVEKIRENTAGITSPQLAEAMEEHAAVLKSLGREKEAEKLLTIVAAIHRQNKK